MKDKEVILTVVRSVRFDPNILAIIDDSLKNDEFFILDLIRIDSVCLCVLPVKNHKKYKQFVLEVLIKDKSDHFFNTFASIEIKNLVKCKQNIYRTYSVINILEMLIKEEEQILQIYKITSFCNILRT